MLDPHILGVVSHRHRAAGWTAINGDGRKSVHAHRHARRVGTEGDAENCKTGRRVGVGQAENQFDRSFSLHGNVFSVNRDELRIVCGGKHRSADGEDSAQGTELVNRDVERAGRHERRHTGWVYFVGEELTGGEGASKMDAAKGSIVW